jgi:hypothetical protein
LEFGLRKGVVDGGGVCIGDLFLLFNVCRLVTFTDVVIVFVFTLILD